MEQWISLLIQVPLVGAFIFFSLEMQKRFTASMDRRDEAYLRTLAGLATKIDEIGRDLVEHNAYVRERLNK